MLKETATIVEIKQNSLLLQTQVKTTCGSCQHKESCGTSAVAKAFSPKVNVIAVNYDPQQYPEVAVGDTAIIGVSEQLVVKSAFYVYLLPIVGFVLLAFIGQIFIEQQIIALTGTMAELITAVLAFFGGYCGYLVAKWRLSLMGDNAQSSDDLACHSAENIQILSIESNNIAKKVEVI